MTPFFFFLYFSRLEPNLIKSEILGIGVLEGAQVGVCDTRCIDLIIDMLEILGTHFCYNKKLKEAKSFCETVTEIQRVLKIWKMR